MHVESATPDMFDSIHEVLLESFGPGKLGKADWQRLLDYEFEHERKERGWVLVDGPTIVGFLGAIFSQRAGERFCNLTAWAVKKRYRKASLELLLPMLELHGDTLLNLSPSPFTLAVFKRMGFSELEDRVVIIPPLLPQCAPRGYELVTDPPAIARILRGEDLRIFRDHRTYACSHVVFAGSRDYSYVVAGKTHLRRWPTTFVYYRSNPDLFRGLAGPMQRAFLRLHKTPFSIVDARMVAATPIRGAFTHKLMQPRLYRPAAAARRREDIDTLYTEFVLLDPRRWTFNF